MDPKSNDQVEIYMDVDDSLRNELKLLILRCINLTPT